MYLHKLTTQQKELIIYRVMTNINNPWLGKVEDALKECGIMMETITQTNMQHIYVKPVPAKINTAEAKSAPK